MEAQGQCVLLDSDTGTAGAQDIDMYQYLAFGGTAPVTYDVSVMEIADEDAMTYETGHGFDIEMNDGDVMLSGRPNLLGGDYVWMLNASDASDQEDAYRKWNLRVSATGYIEPVGTSDNDEAITDTLADEWADFISSEFTPSEFDVPTSREPPATGADEPTTTVVRAVKLDGTTEADRSISGNLAAASDNGDVADIDVIWVGGLTPSFVIDVKVKGDSELPTGTFNMPSVVLRPHVPGGKHQDPITPTASGTDGYEDAYKDLDCGFYYLEVTGEAGNYTVSWNFAASAE